MEINDPLGNSEPEAKSTKSGANGRLALSECFEDPRLQLRLDADAVVGEFDHDLTGSRVVGRDLDATLLGGEGGKKARSPGRARSKP